MASRRLPAACWMFAVLMAFGSAIEFCLVYFGPQVLIATGMSAAAASAALGANFLGILIGRMVGATLTRRVGNAVSTGRWACGRSIAIHPRKLRRSLRAIRGIRDRASLDCWRRLPALGWAASSSATGATSWTAPDARMNEKNGETMVNFQADVVWAVSSFVDDLFVDFRPRLRSGRSRRPGSRRGCGSRGWSAAGGGCRTPLCTASRRISLAAGSRRTAGSTSRS